MDGLKDAVLVRSEFLEFAAEKLLFLAGEGLFVEDEDVGDVIIVDLQYSQ